MRILVRIGGAVLGAVVILVVIGLFLPAERTVTRSIVIEAPPATVFALVNGFRHFNRFSPWASRDTKGDYTYTGPTEGVGAKMAWSSETLGAGEQEITTSTPYERVEGVIRFEGQGSADVAFDITPVEAGSQVSWSFHIDVGWNLFDRYFGLVMDDLVGSDYEEGLQKLKQVAEAYPPLDLADFDPVLREQEKTPLLRTRKRTAMEPEAMLASMRAAFGALDTVLSLNEVEKEGRPRIITIDWNEAESSWTFDAAYPLAQGTPITIMAPGIDRETGYGGLVMEVVLEGADWEESSLAYEKAELYRELHGLESTGDSWEEYESDPTSTPPEELVTHIVFPVRRIPLE